VALCWQSQDYPDLRNRSFSLQEYLLLLEQLLEPNPFIFNELKKNYAKNDRAVLLNAALTEADCQLEMNCIDPDQVKAQELPEWVMGVSSFHDDKNVLDGRDISPQLHERILKSVRRTSVKGLDVKSVIAESGVGLPDVLVVDAEGADAQVIRLILSEGRQPMIVHFEHCNLSEAETKQVNQLLTPDYVLLKFGNDTTAYKADIFKEYCVFLAVEHGILNIFGSLLGKVKLFHTSKSLFSPAQEGHGAAVPSSPSEKTLDENNFITLSLLHSTIQKTIRKGLASRLQRLGDSLRKRLSTRPRKKDFPLEKRLQRHARYSRRLTNILGAYALVATIALCLR
jgi:FkbM family methyltransferase